MFDKYFKRIAADTTPQTGGSGYDGCNYLMSWYYTWGGGIGESWAWIIGSSYCHWGYQNPMAAWIAAGLSDQGSSFAGNATNCQRDWETSLDRQLEFYEWLQVSNGTFGGGCTNSWKGRHLSYPSGQATFHGMA
jgi:hypothetical protein